MRLGDRIKAADVAGEEPMDFLLAPEPVRDVIDPFVGLKQRAQERLYARMGGRITDPSMSEAELRQLLIQELSSAIDEDAERGGIDELVRICGTVYSSLFADRRDYDTCTGLL